MTLDEFSAEVAAAIPAALALFTGEERVALAGVPVVAVAHIPARDWAGNPFRAWGQFRTRSREIVISLAIAESCPDPETRRSELVETLWHEFDHALGRHMNDGMPWSEVRPTNWTVDVKEPT